MSKHKSTPFPIPPTRRQRAEATRKFLENRPLPHYGDWPAWLHIDWERSPDGKTDWADIDIPEEWTEEHTAIALHDLEELHIRAGQGFFYGESEKDGTVRLLRMVPEKYRDATDAEIVEEAPDPAKEAEQAELAKKMYGDMRVRASADVQKAWNKWAAGKTDEELAEYGFTRLDSVGLDLADPKSPDVPETNSSGPASSTPPPNESPEDPSPACTPPSSEA